MHYNFGASLMPMPFKCRFLKVRFPCRVPPTDLCALDSFGQDASQKDVSIKATMKPSDGQCEAIAWTIILTVALRSWQFEVIFPVAVPDEGGFDWLDQFMESHPCGGPDFPHCQGQL